MSTSWLEESTREASANRWRFCRTRMSQSTSSSKMKAVVKFCSTTLTSVSPRLRSSFYKTHSYFCRAFMCVLQLPRMPGRSLRFSSGGGYAVCLILSPVTPSTNSSLMFDMAAERDIASRRSVRKGRLSTNIFWNYGCVNVSHSSYEDTSRLVFDMCLNMKRWRLHTFGVDVSDR